MKKLVCTLALLATPMAASASEREGEVFTATISFDRAALATEEGVEKVLKQIEIQAREVCTIRQFDRDIVDRACVKDIVAKAVSEIGDDRLTLAVNETSRG